MTRLLISVAATVALAGCAASVQAIQLEPPQTNQVRDRNYVLGQARTVVVGEPLVRVREYDVTTMEGAVFEVRSAAEGRAGMNSFVLSPGQKLPIVGERNIDGRTYYVAMTPGGVGIQVAKDDGSIFDHVINQSPFDGRMIPVLPKLNFTPAPPRLERTVDTRRRTRPTDVNYEIVFNGIDGEAMRFQYREYTSDDMARPAFAQDLSYPRTADRFRFRDVAVRVLRVGVDDLEYVVEAD